MEAGLKICLVAVALVAAPAIAQQEPIEGAEASNGAVLSSEQGIPAADRILSTLTNSDLQSLAEDALVRNPRLAEAIADARAADLHAPQVRALPDPVAGATAWLAGAETRTGPQVLTLSWTQALPWLSKLDLSEQKALLAASEMHLKVEAKRLELITSVRRIYYELAFQARQAEITQDFLDHLRQHESISRSRYAAGVGASQDVVKIQAEITLAENLLFDIDQRRIDLEAELNRMRDRPASTLVLPAKLPIGSEIGIDFKTLLQRAEESRPEVQAADVRIAATEVGTKLAKKNYMPDFNVGLTYTFVDRRDDPAGILLPPEGNGDDILGLQGGVRIPIWRKKLNAGVEQATEIELSAHEARRDLLAGIEADLGDLLQRIPLTWQQLRLLEDILIVQARESVQSAQSNYVSGTYNALDLLDAEHVLFEADTAVARAQADYAIRLAQLEGVVGGPLTQKEETERSDS